MSRRLQRGKVPTTAVVSGLAAALARGTVRLGGLAWTCALGRAGRRTGKREGDGATPVGCWLVACVLYGVLIALRRSGSGGAAPPKPAELAGRRDARKSRSA